MTVRSRIATLVAEFLGTAVLATVAINVSRSQIGIGYFVAIGVGITLALLVLIFGKVSGAHVNPAVTIGMWTLRKIGTVQALAFLAVQMLGGLAAWQLANYWVGQEITSIAGNTFDMKVLVAEAVGTFIFTFAFAAAVYQNLETGQKAALIGGGLFLGVIAASLASNGVLNPAIALANQSWSRAYIFGPIIGGVIGFNLYVLLFAPASSLLPGRRAKAAVVSAPAAPASRATAKRTTTKRKTATRKRK